MKKTICLICALLLFVCLFSACSKEPAATDSATETDGRFVPSVSFPKITDTNLLYLPGDVEDSGDNPPDNGVAELPSVNLALLSDEAAIAALVSSFDSSRYHFDVHFKARQTLSSAAGTLAEWSGEVWQLGGDKRCEYTLNGKEYKAWVVDGVYYYNQYGESGNASLKKDASSKAKTNYISQQEAFYEAIWNLSAGEFSQLALTRNGSSGYTLTCANPSEDARALLANAVFRVGEKQVTAMNNASLVATFDKDGVLLGYSYGLDLTAAETEGSLAFLAQYTEISHDATQISVKTPDNAGDYKE